LPEKLPIEETKEEDMEEKIEREIEYIKNSSYYKCFQKYLAVKEEDLNVCKTEDCKSFAKGLLIVRYLGERRFADFKIFVKENYEGIFKDKDLEKMCVAFKNNDCDILNGWEKNACKGIFNGDVDLTLKAFLSSPLKVINMDKDAISVIIAIFWGFRRYSYLVCERYLKKEALCEQLACEIIFSPDAEERIKRIMRDIAIFNLSRKEKDKNLCEFIENSKIKKACLNPHIKTLREIW